MLSSLHGASRALENTQAAALLMHRVLESLLQVLFESTSETTLRSCAQILLRSPLILFALRGQQRGISSTFLLNNNTDFHLCLSMEDEFVLLRKRGNVLFERAQFAEAEALYTASLARLDLERAKLLANRALRRLKQSCTDGSKSDCREGLQLDPANPKLHYRLAQSTPITDETAVLSIARGTHYCSE